MSLPWMLEVYRGLERDRLAAELALLQTAGPQRGVDRASQAGANWTKRQRELIAGLKELG